MDIDYKFGSELPRGDGQPANPTSADDNPFVRPIDGGVGGGGPAGGGGGGGLDEFDFGVLPPPIPDGGDRDINGPVPDEDKRAMQEPKPITQDEAKSAMAVLANSNFCYGKRPANEMTVLNMKPTSAYHYCLESFTETRATTQAEVPFTGGGQSVDTSANGPAPSPWEVPVQAKEPFKDEKKVAEVPHTAAVQPCKKCNGQGQEKCTTCQSSGQVKCPTCNGAQGTQCAACAGHGAKPCSACAGKGVKQCSVCKGAKMVKSFVQLTVEWVNHVSHFVHQKEISLPEELVRGAQGQIAFKEQNPWVYPISQCPEAAINQASLEMLTKHKNDYKNERLLQQRQTVKIVPVTEVQCQWEGKSFTQYVYGIENLSHCSDYPQKWCCGYCNIL